MSPASAPRELLVHGATTRRACRRRRGRRSAGPHRWGAGRAERTAGTGQHTPAAPIREAVARVCGRQPSRSMTTTATHRAGRLASGRRALGDDVAQRAVGNGGGRSAGGGRLATSPLTPADRIGGGVDVDGASAQWLFAMQSGREKTRETIRILAVGHADPPFCTQPPWRCAAPVRGPVVRAMRSNVTRRGSIHKPRPDLVHARAQADARGPSGRSLHARSFR